jgi:PAS domain S-box-containing protein
MIVNPEILPAKPLRLLLVEDNEDDAYFLLRDLQRSGYAVTCERVDTAPAMRAALEHQPWDIVIADYVMPHFSGLAALAELQAAGQDLPFIIVSGTIGEDIAVAAMKAGAHDYLMKGKLARLAPAIERELREAEARRQRRQTRAELQASEAKYKSLSDELPVGIYRSAADGRVLHANPALAALFGFASVEEMLVSGSVDSMYADPAERRRQVAEWKPGGEPITREIRSRTRDGREIWVRDTGRVIFDPISQITYMDGIIEDITERKRAEAVEKATYQISEAAISTRNLDELYHSIHQILGALMPINNFFIALHDPAAETLYYPYYVDEYDPPPPGQVEKAGHSLTAYVLRTGKPLLAPVDKIAELTIQGEIEVIGTPSIDWMGVPLRIGEHTLGAMVVQSYTEGIRFSQADLNILAFVSSQVAMAIDRKRAEESLRLAQFSIEHAVDSILWMQRDARLVYVNDAACRTLGYTRAELLALTVHDIDPDFLSDAWDRYLAQLRQRGSLTNESRYRTKNALAFPVEITSNYLLFEGQEYIFCSVRDITARKQAEAQLQHQLQRLAALRAIDMAITTSFDLRVTLNILLDQGLPQLGADAAVILQFNSRLQVLEYCAGRGFRNTAITRSRLRLGDGPGGRAALERRNLHVANLVEENANFSRRLAGEMFASYYALPITSKGDLKGLLEIFHHAAFAPNTEWIDFAETLAGQAAIAMDNIALFEGLERSNIELAVAYDTTLEGWSRALDLRDKETEGHSERVTELTLRLGRALGLDEAELAHVRRGALLHDIGKMGIPDSILLKAGPLTPEEWVTMRRHPTYAYELLSPIAFLRPALDIPYGHHEKWDGTGYPRGLKGDQIPLSARIFAVVDVWDALCSDRPYRPAWPKEKVRAHIRSLAGTHFDRQVVAQFLKLEI